MAGYRLTHAAQADTVSILAWSDEQFGEEARNRYEALIAAAIRDAAAHVDDFRRRPRRPRHLLICRRDDHTLVIGRILHDAMDLQRHVDPRHPWG